MADYRRGSSGNESPAAMRFGRSKMHSGGDVDGGSTSKAAPKQGYGDHPSGRTPMGRSDVDGNKSAPPKGYGNEGSRTPGGKKGR